MIFKIRNTFYLIVFSFTFLYCNAECITIAYKDNKLMDFAREQASVARIPEYKAAIFLDREDKTNLTTNKITLVNSYKHAHFKPEISTEQKTQILKIEEEKRLFLKNKICVN